MGEGGQQEEWKETRPWKWGEREGNRRSRTKNAVEERRKKAADRVARHQADYCDVSLWRSFMTTELVSL